MKLTAGELREMYEVDKPMDFDEWQRARHELVLTTLADEQAKAQENLDHMGLVLEDLSNILILSDHKIPAPLRGRLQRKVKELGRVHARLVIRL